MARFYRTASARPIDYMYRLNVPLMQEVLQQNDQFITENLQQLQQLETAGNTFPFLEADAERAKAITDAYTQQIDALSETIRKDPANWRKQLAPIRDISKKLQRDYATGEIGKIATNYGKYKQVSDYIDKQIESYNKDGKGISAEEGRAFKEYFKRNFKGTGYNAETGTYNPINVFNPGNTIDIRKVLGEELDKLKADKNSYKVDEITGNEMYFNTKKQAWEGVTPEKILSIITDRLNNPQLMNYLRERTGVGLLNNVFDDRGQLIAPYNMVKTGRTPQEEAYIKEATAKISKTKDAATRKELESRLNNYINKADNRSALQWNPNSYLSPIFRGLVDQFSWDKTETESTLKNNSAWNTKFTQAQANARHNSSLVQAKTLAEMREQGVNDRFNETMKYNWAKLELDKEKMNRTGTGKTGKDTVIPVPTTTSKIATNSFEDWTTTSKSGEEVPVLSNKGLSAEIDKTKEDIYSTKQQIDSIDKQMNSLLKGRDIDSLSDWEANQYSLLKIQKEQIAKTIPLKENALNQRRQWYGASVEAALSSSPQAFDDNDPDTKPLSPQEVALYREFDTDRTAKKFLDKMNNEMPAYLFPSMNQGAYASKVGRWLDTKFGDDKDYQALRGKITDYLNIKGRVDKRRDTFLKNMRSNPIETDAIQLGTEDQKEITNLLFSAPQGLRIYDSKGRATDKLELEGKGIEWPWKKDDEYRMSFDGTNQNLLDYIVEHNVTPVVEQIGNSTKLGTGNAIAKVTFKDPNGQIKSDQPYYIELTPQMQRAITNKFSKSKNPEVVKLANDIADERTADLRRQFIQPGSSNFTVYVPDPQNRGKIPFNVKEVLTEDGDKFLNITRTNINGQQVPVDFKDSPVPGMFKNSQDFIDRFKNYTNTLNK